MHQPIQISDQAPCAIVPAQPQSLQPRSSQPDEQKRPRHYGQLQQQMLQQGEDLSASLHQHSQLLNKLGEQSLSSWYGCRESASLTRQQAFAAVDRATSIEPEIAQLNRTIQRQLQQFDAQLQISTQTLRQEVAQKVGQYRRHVQQQSEQCRDRLKLTSPNQPGLGVPQLSPAQKLFQSTTLRSLE